jgi:hypothetical protein
LTGNIGHSSRAYGRQPTEFDEPAFDAANVLRLGQDMSVLSIRPDLVVVDQDQSALIRL